MRSSRWRPAERMCSTLPLLALVEVRHAHQLPEAEDGVERGAEFMAHPGDELVFRPVRAFRLDPAEPLGHVLARPDQAPSAVGLGPVRRVDVDQATAARLGHPVLELDRLTVDECRLHRVGDAPPVVRRNQLQERPRCAWRLRPMPAVDASLLWGPADNPIPVVPLPAAHARDPLRVLEMLPAELEVDRKRLRGGPRVDRPQVEEDETTKEQRQHDRSPDGRLPERPVCPRAVPGACPGECGEHGIMRAEDGVRGGLQSRQIPAGDDPHHRAQRREVESERGQGGRQTGGRRHALQNLDLSPDRSLRPQHLGADPRDVLGRTAGR